MKKDSSLPDPDSLSRDPVVGSNRQDTSGATLHSSERCYCLIDSNTGRTLAHDKMGLGVMLAERYIAAVNVLDSSEREELTQKGVIFIAAEGAIPSIEDFQSGLRELLHNESGFTLLLPGANSASSHGSLFLAETSGDLLQALHVWYSETDQFSFGESSMATMDEGLRRDTRGVDSRDTNSDKDPKIALAAIKSTLARLDREQQADREHLAAMLQTLEGNPSFTGEERRQFVQLFNALLDRLGLSLFLPGATEPVRLATRPDRGKTYFRLGQGAKKIGGAAALWKLEIRQSSPRSSD